MKLVLLQWLLLSNRTQIQIPARTRVGEGLYIGHLGRVIIHPDAILGKNINIGTGVTIGAENRGKRKGAPQLGDNCWFGTNAVIVGNVKIGSDVLVAPLSFVNFDVPDHSVVIGNPGKIIPKETARRKKTMEEAFIKKIQPNNIEAEKSVSYFLSFLPSGLYFSCTFCFLIHPKYFNSCTFLFLYQFLSLYNIYCSRNKYFHLYCTIKHLSYIF